MNKIKTLKLYIINYFWLLQKKIFNSNLQFKKKQLIGKYATINVSKSGTLSIGNKLYSRTGLHILVESGNCVVGDNCFFNHNCSITCLKSIKIGNKCTFGNNLVIVDHDHNFKNSGTPFIYGAINIKDSVWVGANVTILKGVTIGENSIIAAGSVVNKSVPDNSLWIEGRISIIEGR